MGEPVDPFVPESVTVKIKDQELVIAPLPFKQFRRAIGIARSALSLAQAEAEANPMGIVDGVPDIIMGKFSELAPILFSRQDLGAEWFDENMTVPMAKHCLEQAAVVNGVGDFLAYLRKAALAQRRPEAQ
jgi:hypothetical protein